MSAANYCSRCGAILAPSARFCPGCGAGVGGGAVTPKRTGHIKYRNMWMQVLLMVVTLGIYSIYWFYVTLDELHKANGKDEGAGLWTVLYLIPIANFFAYWHHSAQYAEFVDNRYPGIAIFILWIVFSPAVWFIAQLDLNKAAQSRPPQPQTYSPQAPPPAPQP